MERRQSRGRVRGRARSVQQEPPSGLGQDSPRSESPTGEDVVHQEKRQRMYEDDNGSDSSGHMSTNGGGNGSNGNDRSSSGSNGARRSPGERGLFPRGVLHGAEMMEVDESQDRRQIWMDFVKSRPAGEQGTLFEKQGTYTPSDRKVNVIANYYEIRTHPKFQCELYAVRVEPPVEEDSKVKRLVNRIRQRIGPYLLTGRQLFRTVSNLTEFVFHNVKLADDSEENFTITLELVRQVDPSEPLVFQFYNIVARKMQSMMNMNLLGRFYYNPEQKQEFPSHKLELWPGFQNSIRQQERGLLLNVESVWKVLLQESIFEKMAMIRRSNPNNFMEICNNEINGMQVVTVYNKKAYKIDHILFDKNPTHTFPMFDRRTGTERQITYKDYYQERYNVTILNVRQPLLQAKPSKKDIRRGQTEGAILVPELCWPCGLTEDMRGNFRLMKDLACCFHMAPNRRVETMNDFVARVRNNAQIADELKGWGCKLSDTPVNLDARVYAPEEVVFAGGRVKANDQADWTFALRNNKMMTSMVLNRWVIIVGNQNFQGVPNLIGTMQRVATPLGYKIISPLDTHRVGGMSPQVYSQAVVDVVTKYKGQLDMIFIVLPNNKAETYGEVKKKCAIQYGIPSQCFLSKHFNNTKGLMSICTKLVIQMNAKQGGEPWGAVVPLKDMMVLGYDVHHAGPGGGASFGAMTATVNATYGKYFSCVERQLERAEIYTHVAEMFGKCLAAYQNLNKILPRRIIMYRDGVGEGQLSHVYEQELKAFEEKIAKFYPAEQDQPKFTYIVVNKKINTRFFVQTQPRRYENPNPGTLVDTVVTRPERYDFFLVSQIARQGCVSPTYYNVLRDGSGLPPDKIQRLTFKFCHLYYNWSGTVAVPAPCQNAHKLALLTGTALKGKSHNNLDYLLHYL